MIAEDRPRGRLGDVRAIVRIAEMIAETNVPVLTIGVEAMKIVGKVAIVIGMIAIEVLGNLVAVDGAIVSAVRMKIGRPDDDMMKVIVIADLIVLNAEMIADLIVEAIDVQMKSEAIGVAEIRVIAEMIVQNVEMIHAIGEMIRVNGGMILEMIVDSIVDLLVEMIGTIVEVEVGDPLQEMIVGTIVDLHEEMIVGTIVEMIGSVGVVIVLNDEMIEVVIVLSVEMIAVAIARLIIGDPDHELCLHPRMNVVIVHQEMVHRGMVHRGMVHQGMVHQGMVHQGMIHQPNDPEVIKNRKMTVGVQLLNVNKCLIYSKV